MTHIISKAQAARARLALSLFLLVALVATAARKLVAEFEDALGMNDTAKRSALAVSTLAAPMVASPSAIFAPRDILVMPGAAKTGTLSVADLRRVQNQSAVEYGMDTISDVFARDLTVYQGIMSDLLNPLANVTADRQRIYGTSDSSRMTKVDEYGRAATRRIRGGTTVGFPMDAFQYAIGWTRKYLENHTPAELADQFTGAKRAHAVEVATQIKRAIYLSSNYTFSDHLVDNVDLAVKRFVNADSAAIPSGPNAEEFDGATHTHYDAIAGLTAAALKALIRDVVEHGHGGRVIVAINLADEDTVRGLTGFKEYVDPRLALGTSANAATQRLDITRLDNRAIGIFDAAEIWVKPWALANYAFAYDATTDNKPLVVRTRSGRAPTLNIAAEITMYPLQAQYMESEFGVGVWTRTNGAVLYFGGGAYTDPTLT
jgi:hypothetical protein